MLNDAEILQFAVEGIARRISEAEAKRRKAANIREEQRYMLDSDKRIKKSYEELSQIIADASKEIDELGKKKGELEWLLALNN